MAFGPGYRVKVLLWFSGADLGRDRSHDGYQDR